jgi:hypothetical protein
MLGTPPHYDIFGRTSGDILLSYGSETLDLTSERLEEMFKGDSAEMCAGKLPLVSVGGRGDNYKFTKSVIIIEILESWVNPKKVLSCLSFICQNIGKRLGNFLEKNEVIFA